MTIQDQLHEYIEKVDNLLEIDGCTVSADFSKTRAGWQVVATSPDIEQLRQRISDAAVSGDPEKVQQAISDYTVADAAQPSKWRDAVARTVHGALVKAYANTAKANYQAIAGKFDEAAKSLHECAAVVDVSLSAEEVVSLTSKRRQSWMDSCIAAKELDKLFPLLGNAAELAGVTLHKGGVLLRPWVFALAADAEGVHRRQAWGAYESKGHRCGRWGALVQLGCIVRAASLDNLEPYRQPRAFETRYRPGAMGPVAYKVDPEDAEYTPASDTDTPAGARKADRSLARAWDKHAERSEVNAAK